MFEGLSTMLFNKIEESRNSLKSTEYDDIYVYLAADNEQVKEAFAATIRAKDPGGQANSSISLMRMETKFVQHIKNLANMKIATNNEGAPAAAAPLQYIHLFFPNDLNLCVIGEADFDCSARDASSSIAL